MAGRARRVIAVAEESELQLGSAVGTEVAVLGPLLGLRDAAHEGYEHDDGDYHPDGPHARERYS